MSDWRAHRANTQTAERPPVARARVTRAPASSGDTLDVELVNAPGLADTVVEWSRATLPAVGDECLVAYDDAGEPWVVMWAN